MGYKHWKYQSTANWNLIDSNSQESIELWPKKANSILRYIKKKERGQQIEGGSPPPLLYPRWGHTGVLSPIEGSPVQESQRSPRSLVEGDRDN